MSELTSRYWPMLEAFMISFAGAVFILIIGWTISNVVAKATLRIGKSKYKLDTTALPMISAFLQWAIRILTLVVVLSQFGVQTASLIAALGAAGVAIGLALQGTLQNIAAGIMLLSLRPLAHNEYVSIANQYEGKVLEIGLFLTRLEQANGITLTIPNSVVWNSTIINFNRNPNRRIDLPVALQYGEDTERAIQVLTDLLSNNDKIIKHLPLSVFVSEYRENSLILTIRAWVSASNYATELANVMLDVRKTLESEGFELPITKVGHVKIDAEKAGEIASSEAKPTSPTLPQA